MCNNRYCGVRHVSGSAVAVADPVLFIAYCLGSSEHPYLDEEQFELVVQFILKCKDEGSVLKYV